MKNYIFKIILFLILVLVNLQYAQGLQIDSITPAPNANNIDANVNIVIEFNRSVSGSTVNDSTIIVRGNQSGILSGSLSGGNTDVITFNPNINFRAGEVISCTITNLVRSDSGFAMSRGHTYSFTVSTGPSPLNPPEFTFRPISGASIQGEDAKVLDYNNDGYLDILTSNEGIPEQIYVMQNDGLFEFCVINTYGSFRNVEVYDIDDDGDYDNFGSNSNASDIYWFENEGNFLPTQHSIRGINAQLTNTLAGGDLDSDGDIDVLEVNTRINPSIAYRLYWYANDGDGNFSSGNEITTSYRGGSDSYFYMCDLNSDGAMDFLAFQEDDFSIPLVPNNIVWYENNGTNGFDERYITTMDDEGRLTYADINGDGHMDFIWVSTENSPTIALAWFENNGSESFTQHPISVTSTDRLYSVSATDLDGDQDMDILAGGYWFENDGSETFYEHSLSDGLSNGTNYLANGISHGDMDNDGDMDVIVQGQYTTAWLENTQTMNVISTIPVQGGFLVPDGNVSITFSQPISSSSLTNSIRLFSNTRGYINGIIGGGGTSTITFNPDEDLFTGEVIEVSIKDIVKSTSNRALPNSYGFSFRVQTNVPNAVDFIAHPVNTHNSDAVGLDIADMDGDGDMDLLSCSYTELYWHENDGAGGFVSHKIDSVGTYFGVFANDEDEDGDVDIYVDLGGNTFDLLYVNDGNENFTSENLTRINLQQYADVNNDGDRDMVYFGSTNAYLYWSDKNCESYSVFGNIPDVNNNDVIAGDLDNDGDTDFLGASTTGPIIYRNNDYYIFSDVQFSNNDTKVAQLADLDGDGYLDPIFVESNTALIWYENISVTDSIIFGERQVIDSTVLDYRDVIAVDIDGDNDADIAAVSSYDDKVVWFENRLNEASNDFGPEQFGQTIANGPVKILSADLDGDNDPDLVTISVYDDELNWYENTGGIVNNIDKILDAPITYQLLQNYPNPFNPNTKIMYDLPKSGKVKIEVFNLLGQKIKTLLNESMPSGSHEMEFIANNLPSGVYLYRIEASNYVNIKKMILMK